MSDHMKKSDCIASAEINGDKFLNKVNVDSEVVKQPGVRFVT